MNHWEENVKQEPSENQGYDLSPKSKKAAIKLLESQSAGSFGKPAEVQKEILKGLKSNKSFETIMTEMKNKYKNDSEGLSVAASFYDAAKGPQWNEHFSDQYKGETFAERNKALKKEIHEFFLGKK